MFDLSCNKIRKIENMNFKHLNELRFFANEIEEVENLDKWVLNNLSRSIILKI
jgi:hypothetical protein